jgi:hypothetical protein
VEQVMNKATLITLTDAMLAWTGWKTEVSPLRDDKLFTDRFGHEQATKWLPVLHALEDDFYASDACYTAANLQEMVMISTRHFCEKHPEVEELVVQALAWCYTFDYK